MATLPLALASGLLSAAAPQILQGGVKGIRSIFGFEKGGQVPRTGVYKLHKGEMVVPASQAKALAGLIGKKPRKSGPKKGARSKTHPGDMDFTSKRGDKVHHIGGKDVKRKRAPFARKAAPKRKAPARKRR